MFAVFIQNDDVLYLIYCLKLNDKYDKSKRIERSLLRTIN